VRPGCARCQRSTRGQLFGSRNVRMRDTSPVP
jgi:hypothetical protein